MIITIDGPAAAGKGTLAGVLAKTYHLAYFDTGMVYRAVGLDMYLNNDSPENENKAEEYALNLTFSKMNQLAQNPDFRSAIGGKYASIVSAHPKVRAALLKMQQNFALNPTFADGTPAQGAIYDGRDTGTVVCPNADIKFFITASTEVRAMRRFKEFEAKGIETDFQTVLNDMKARDERDASRATAPMKPAVDAIIFDTSTLSIDEVLAFALKIIDKKIKNS
ncbi:MAG: (d)CMP kinase [Alphaproteobacteria bacterium]|nr:(d)CMP kinase [Alphaproteobacteria bacterium]